MDENSKPQRLIVGTNKFIEKIADALGIPQEAKSWHLIVRYDGPPRVFIDKYITDEGQEMDGECGEYAIMKISKPPTE